MMRAIVMRDLTLMARRRGLIAALLAHAALMSGFMLAWSAQGRVPVLRGANLYEQLGIVQWAFVALLAPWLAARMTAAERRDEWARLSALTGRPPARLIAVRCGSLAVLTAAVLAAAWPAVLLASEMSGGSLAEVAFDQLVLFLAASCAGAVTLCVELSIEDRLTSWMAATLTSVAIFTALGAIGSAAALTAIGGTIAATGWLIHRADATLWHLAVRRV